MSETIASVNVLTAEVRTLMVGRRQVTLSVYRQLDEVPDSEIEPFGRVRDSKDDEDLICIVGIHAGSGSLVRASRPRQGASIELHISGPRWSYHSSRLPGVTRVDVLQRDNFTVYARLGDSASPAPPREEMVLGGHAKPYGSSRDYEEPWWFVSRDAEAQVLAGAEVQVAAARTRKDAAVAWEALPLIVLAGLR